MIRKVIAIIIGLAGIAAGAWFAIGWMLVGGITKAINAYDAVPRDVHGMVWGIVRAVFFESGFLVMYLFWILAAGLWYWGDSAGRKRNIRTRKSARQNRKRMEKVCVKSRPSGSPRRA